jgi:hypothetical protein
VRTAHGRRYGRRSDEPTKHVYPLSDSDADKRRHTQNSGTRISQNPSQRLKSARALTGRGNAVLGHRDTPTSPSAPAAKRFRSQIGETFSMLTNNP